MQVTALAIAAAIAFTSAAAADTAGRSMGVKSTKGDRVTLSTQSTGRQGSETAPGASDSRPQFGTAPLFTANAPATPPAPRTRGLSQERPRLTYRSLWFTGVFQ
ncbi:MAG TPA: hypothetical protein PKD10_02235 [Paracoccaceae bacterium]|nr:hypothetical protein [Paracoccaceae bacterium]